MFVTKYINLTGKEQEKKKKQKVIRQWDWKASAINYVGGYSSEQQVTPFMLVMHWNHKSRWYSRCC